MLSYVFNLSGSNDLNSKILEQMANQYADRVVYILDGYDEFDIIKSPYKDIILQIIDGFGNLSRSSVIVTSRPKSALTKNLEINYELIGFNRSNIYLYIDEAVTIVNRRSTLKKLFDGNPVILNLCTIPRVLADTCYLINLDENLQFSGKNRLVTYTTFYQTLITYLWKTFNEIVSNKYSSDELASLKQKTSLLLQRLAFYGILNNQYEFTYADIFHHAKTIFGLSDFSDLDLYIEKILSSHFLSCSSHIDLNQRSYFFSHLTHQEYFAAMYFVCYFAELLTLYHRTKSRVVTA